jgi:hypothetical protein
VELETTLALDSYIKMIKVPISMKVILKRLSGKALCKIKAPPSTRIWIGFYNSPIVDIEIIPTVVNTAAFRLSIITDYLKSEIIQLLKDSVVLPSMEDISFGNYEEEIEGVLVSSKVPLGSFPPNENEEELKEINDWIPESASTKLTKRTTISRPLSRTSSLSVGYENSGLLHVIPSKNESNHQSPSEKHLHKD